MGFILNSDEDFEVINIDKLTYAGNPENLSEVVKDYAKRYKFHKVDICDFKTVNEIVIKEN